MIEERIAHLESENLLLRRQLSELHTCFEGKIAELSTIKEIGAIIRHIGSFEKTCHSILEVVAKDTLAQNCSIMLFDQERNRLFLAAATNPAGKSYVIDVRKVFSREGIRYSFSPGQGAAGRAVLYRKPVLVEDVARSPHFSSAVRTDVRIGSLLSLPLIIDETVLGVLNLSHKEKGILKSGDIHLLSILSDIIALFILSCLGHERLKSSEKKYRVLAENVNDGIAIIQNGMHVYANPKYMEITGRKLEELQSLPLHTLYTVAATDADNRAQTLLTTIKVTDEPFEARLRSKDGREIEVEINTSETIHNSKSAFILSVRDLTERKLLERRLVQAQKMEAVGALAAGIAHDFNNLLQGIQGHTDLLTMKLKGKPVSREIEKIASAVRKGSALTQQLLTFGRRIAGNPTAVDLNHEVRVSIEILEHTISGMIRIECDLQKELCIINADPIQMEQIIMNLVLNARDAMPDGGKIRIETRNITLDEEFCRRHIGAKIGDYTLLRVSDSGHGMDENTIEHVFDPFFTTKEMGKGTGLGLAVVYGIVKNHGGYITCSSRPGKGSTFEVFFPAAVGVETPCVRDSAETPRELQGGTETILIIEDEELLRELTADILSSFGYSVLCASNGKDGLELYRSAQAKVDLVILDLIMPGMDGKECLGELLKLNPQVKVLIASGHPPESHARRVLNMGARDFIMKPYEVAQILKVVRNTIDAGVPGKDLTSLSDPGEPDIVPSVHPRH